MISQTLKLVMIQKTKHCPNYSHEWTKVQQSIWHRSVY